MLWEQLKKKIAEHAVNGVRKGKRTDNPKLWDLIRSWDVREADSLVAKYSEVCPHRLVNKQLVCFLNEKEQWEVEAANGQEAL